jgi:hypothetical protein
MAADGNMALLRGNQAQQQPAVFCSPELEYGLADFVTSEVAAMRPFPADEALRMRARLLQNTPTTPADDDVLLEKFKEMMRQRLGLLPLEGSGADVTAAMPDAVQLDEMLQDLNFEFDFGELIPLPTGESQ